MEALAWAVFLWLYFFVRIHSYTLIFLTIYYFAVAIYLLSLQINRPYISLDITYVENKSLHL